MLSLLPYESPVTARLIPNL